MNVASQWRFAFTRQLASVYAANPNVAAVIVSGSTARGHADRYSDIESGVFWYQPPTDADRQAAARAIDGDLHRLYPYDPVEGVWSDVYFLGRAHSDQPKSGVMVEAIHYTTDYINRNFDAALMDYNPDPLKQNLIAGIIDAVPLHNAGLVQKWKERAANYPDGLRLAVVRQHAQIDHFWRSEMWLARGENLMMFYQSFVQAHQQMLHVLLGLNKVYYFGLKWLDVVAGRFKVKPPDLLRRIRRAYQVDPAEGVQEVSAVVEDTYDLIEKELVEIDVEWLRTVFRYRRPLWEQAPPMTDGLAGQ